MSAQPQTGCLCQILRALLKRGGETGDACCETLSFGNDLAVANINRHLYKICRCAEKENINVEGGNKKEGVRRSIRGIREDNGV